MRGFTTTALILLPDFDTYDSRSDSYKYQLRVCVEKIVRYLKQFEIEAHGLYTDDIMRVLRPEDVHLINILSVSDSFFAAKYIDNMRDALTIPRWKNQEVIDKANADADKASELTPEERFALVLKHNSKVAKAFIASYKLVFIFNYKHKLNYKSVSKPTDTSIRVYIDANTFSPTVTMGGMDLDACEVLAVSYGNLPIKDWRI